MSIVGNLFSWFPFHLFSLVQPTVSIVIIPSCDVQLARQLMRYYFPSFVGVEEVLFLRNSFFGPIRINLKNPHFKQFSLLLLYTVILSSSVPCYISFHNLFIYWKILSCCQVPIWVLLVIVKSNCFLFMVMVFKKPCLQNVDNMLVW